jgi:hypothetical protein
MRYLDDVPGGTGEVYDPPELPVVDDPANEDDLAACCYLHLPIRSATVVPDGIVRGRLDYASDDIDAVLVTLVPSVMEDRAPAWPVSRPLEHDEHVLARLITKLGVREPDYRAMVATARVITTTDRFQRAFAAFTTEFRSCPDITAERASIICREAAA